jgi:phage-related protein
VVESVADDRSGTYRTVYTVSLPSAVYVLHVFQKKSRRGIATPREHLATIERRLQAAIAHHREHHEQAKQATKRSEER